MNNKILRNCGIFILIIITGYFALRYIYTAHTYVRYENARKQDKRINGVLNGQQGWTMLKNEMLDFMDTVDDNTEEYIQKRVETNQAERFPLLYRLATKRIIVSKGINGNLYMLVDLEGSPPDIPYYGLLLTTQRSGGQEEEYIERIIKKYNGIQKEAGLYVLRGNHDYKFW